MFFFLTTNYVSSQRLVNGHLSKISLTTFNSCTTTKVLNKNLSIKKHLNKIIIPLTGNKSKIFFDKSSDSNFKTYTYLGDIQNINTSLVKETEYNTEEFYFINRITGIVDTLIGMPVFSKDTIHFACINNSGTGENQKIQICEIINGSSHTRFFIDLGNHYLTSINCILRSCFYAKDTNNKFWKISF